MNYRKISSDSYEMDIKERDILESIGNQFDNNTIASQQEKQDYYDAFIKYLDYVICYCNDELKFKSYDENVVIPKVFCKRIEKTYKQYLQFSLYCAKLYLEFLKSYIKVCYLERYKTLRTKLLCDIELLLGENERFNKGFKNKIVLAGVSRNKLNTWDMWHALTKLRMIENITEIKNLPLRDIKPYQMFVIRQILETLGKNIIGYDELVDKNDKIVPKFTQISWEFLKVSEKKASWTISSPISLSNIWLLNKWANSFVHTGYIYPSYMIYYATIVIDKLMRIPQKTVECYNGTSGVRTSFGDIKIKNYTILKKDFEKYIYEKNKEVSIKWKNSDDVGAYIIGNL